MLNLLVKDFKLLFGSGKKSSSKWLATLMTLLFTVLLVIIEVVVFNTILTKIGTTKSATIAYVNLFLTIISVIMIISGVIRAKQLFFNAKDTEQLVVRPVTNSQIIISKLIFLFLTHYALTIVFVYPLLISYSTHVYTRGIFFYMGIFYPAVTFLFEIGLALLFVYPVWLFEKFLKKHFIIRFSLILVILIAGCILYAKVLDTFMEILTGGNIDFLKSNEVIDTLLTIRKYCIPNRYIVDAYFMKSPSSIRPYLLISLGVFIAGVSVAIFAFNYVRNFNVAFNGKAKEREFKITSVKKALFKKEIMLLTKNASYTVSFVGLLIVEPFLIYSVIKVLNQLFRGEMFASIMLIIPNFITILDILIIVLFTLIISQGASDYITMEKKTIKVMKIIPVDPKVQLGIKVMIPFALSTISLIIALVVLLLTKSLEPVPCLFAFIMAIILLAIFTVISLTEELKIRNHTPRSTLMSNLYSYVLPLSYFGISILLCYLGLSMYVSYILGIVLVIGLGSPHLLYLKKNFKGLFMDLDVVN